MIEVTPTSMFGKHSYAKEQAIIMGITKDIDTSVVFISPASISGVLYPVKYLPANFRRKKIREHILKAQEGLKDLGL